MVDFTIDVNRCNAFASANQSLDICHRRLASWWQDSRTTTHHAAPCFKDNNYRNGYE